jgi:hypothetical protein
MSLVDIGHPAIRSGLVRLYTRPARFPIGFNVGAAPSYQSAYAFSKGEEVLCVCDTEILMKPCVRLHFLVPTGGGCCMHLSSRPVALTRWPHHSLDPIGQLQKETPGYQAEEMGTDKWKLEYPRGLTNEHLLLADVKVSEINGHGRSMRCDSAIMSRRDLEHAVVTGQIHHFRHGIGKRALIAVINTEVESLKRRLPRHSQIPRLVESAEQLLLCPNVSRATACARPPDKVQWSMQQSAK